MTPHRLAYLCSKYPYISHTFVTREVEALRELGTVVDTFTVRETPPSALLCDADRREHAATFSILPPKWPRVLGALRHAFAANPIGSISTLALALRLSPGGVRGALWQLFYWVEAVVLWRELERRGIRHIHSHFANNSADIALLATHLGGGAQKGRSWSFTMHGPTEFSDVRLHRLREKAERAAFVVCISDFCRSQLMRLVDESHWDRLEVVHCAVDPTEYRPTERPRKDNEVGILVVARLTPDKGLATVLDAFAQVREAGIRATLTIAGDGPERERLNQRAKRLGIGEHVRFLGSLPPQAIHERYARADVFCLSSFAEGVPVVLMEAMAMGLPVVATRVMGVPELVSEAESGILVSPGRVDELAAALIRLGRDEAERRRLGLAGRRMIESEFNLRPCVQRLNAVFGSYLDRPVTPNQPAGAPRCGPPRRSGPMIEHSRPLNEHTVTLSGVGIQALTEDEAVVRVVEQAQLGEGGFVAFVNVDVLRQIHRRPELRAVMAETSLALADGMPIVWLSRLRGQPVPERVAGSSFIYALAASAGGQGLSIFLLGGAPGIAEAAAAELVGRTPGLRCAGWNCPPLGFEHDDAEIAKLTQALRDSDPDIVFVALGFPKQENLIVLLRRALPRVWFVSSGASFAFAAGRLSRSPAWMQRFGLEWLHRLIHEPRRLARRYLWDDLPFLLRITVATLMKRRRAVPTRALDSSADA